MTAFATVTTCYGARLTNTFGTPNGTCERVRARIVHGGEDRLIIAQTLCHFYQCQFVADVCCAQDTRCAHALLTLDICK
jgi:hypothetical protein